MKKMLMTFALLNSLAFLAMACSQDNTEYMQPHFEDMEAYTPADLPRWPHAVFCFDERTCTDVQTAANRQELGTVRRSGTRTTVVAYSSAENISFSTLQSGESVTVHYTVLAEDGRWVLESLSGTVESR